MNFTPRKIVPDVSFYQDDPTTARQIDFAQMRTMTDGVIIRAGQNTWVDQDFGYNWREAKNAGLKRGSYWYYDSRHEPIAQAQLFCSLFVDDPPEWGLWIDIEENYGGTYKGESNWKKFADVVKQNFKCGIYTANWYWKNQIVTLPEYWGRFPLWVAGYTTSSNDVILPSPWKQAVLWQYTDKGNGMIYGVESANIDLNYTSDDFDSLFGEIDTITHPFAGVEQIRGKRYGWNFVLDIIDPKQTTIGMLHGNKVERPSTFAKTLLAQIATNGGEWEKDRSKPNYQMPKDLSVSYGMTYVSRVIDAYRPSLIILNDGNAKITHINEPNIQHALTGLRYLIRDGQIQKYLYGGEIQYTEGHARTIFGTDAQGRVMVMVCDGTYINAPDGMMLKECAELMWMYGAMIAFDGGGGGDSVHVQSGIITNIPQDGMERFVPETFLVWVKEINTMAFRYDATALGDGVRLRPMHDVNSSYMSYYPKGTVFYGDNLWIAPADGLNVRKGDTWLEVKQIGATTKIGWVAVIHLGAYICSLLDNQPIPITKKHVAVAVTLEGFKPLTIEGDLESV